MKESKTITTTSPPSHHQQFQLDNPDRNNSEGQNEVVIEEKNLEPNLTDHKVTIRNEANAKECGSAEAILRAINERGFERALELSRNPPPFWKQKRLIIGLLGNLVLIIGIMTVIFKILRG